MKKLLTLVVSLTLTLPLAHSQAYLSKGLKAINTSDAQRQMEFLAHDAMQGRKTGTPFAAITAQFIISELKLMGYTPEIVDFEARDMQMQNILVTIKGKDTSKDMVIGAHYDHLGVKDGEIYNGADDNASGVIAVLQIARAIKAAGVQPKNNIILAFWDGEEGGLNGSKNYVANTPDLSRIIAYMNFDLIGRNTDENRPNLFRYFHSAKMPQYKELLDKAIAQYKLNLEPDHRATGDDLGGSDNASFNRKGVPIIWYHTDGHADYHKPTDTAEKINWNKMMDIIRSAYIVGWQVANNSNL